ncbi:MlaD family protein [Anaerorudis cellulosivorans]|uniref:MlaD family protein n=1 Tax=Anaerorudis cellulosivorans TaxID=3397862 RepID=UPI0022210E73|nr:MlaD family protein [Seramator thermalis]MCW1734635.1 MlaD family protein [Seramator thermalis]
MKLKLSKNASIGLSFLISLAIIYFGINFLKGINIFQKQNNYIAVFDDVSGLNISSPVLVNGYQIGLVSSIRIISTDPLKFAVEIRLNNDFKIKEGSTLEFGTDLLGGSPVKLKINNKATRYLNPGDTLLGGRSAGMMDSAEKIVPKADSLLLHIDSTVIALNQLLTNPAWQQSISGINRTVDELQASAHNINNIIYNIGKEIPEITQDLTVVIDNLKKVSDELYAADLNHTLVSLDETITNLNLLSQKINTPDNSLGKLTNGSELHDSLIVTINTATKLLEDVRKNPKKYLSVKLRLF